MEDLYILIGLFVVVIALNLVSLWIGTRVLGFRPCATDKPAPARENKRPGSVAVVLSPEQLGEVGQALSERLVHLQMMKAYGNDKHLDACMERIYAAVDEIAAARGRAG
jgi:hypothetical protein